MRRFLPYLLLPLAVFLVYYPALLNGFVWDDTALVLRDPLIRSPRLLVEGFRHFLFLDATAADFYRPFQRVVYTFDYLVAGFTPWVFHLGSLLIHAGAALALYAFARRWLARAGTADPVLPASVLALIWAVHPIHSSAVVYIAGLADPLVALCGFGGLALLMAGRRVAAGLCLGLAPFAKESGAFMALVGLGFAWILAADGVSDPREKLQRFARVALPVLLLAGIYLGLRTTAEHLPAPAPEPIPFAARPGLGLRAVAEYAGLLAAPGTLHMERDVRVAENAPAELKWAAQVQTVAGALLLWALAFWFFRANPPARGCLLAALALYLPVSNLFALNATIAEHWVYLPSAFLLLAVAAGWPQLPPRLAHWKAAGVLGLWVLMLGVGTHERCADWRDPMTFLEATIRDGGASSRMLGNRALEKAKRGNLAGAAQDNRAALAKKPNQPFAMLNLAQVLIMQQQFSEARGYLDRCDAFPHVRALSLVHRAELEARESGRDRVPLLREAVAVNPRFWPVRKRLISFLLERGEIDAALQELRDVIADQPFRAETWELTAQAFERIGKPELAQMALAEADRRDVWRGKKR